jgi:hypothetical protein
MPTSKCDGALTVLIFHSSFHQSRLVFCALTYFSLANYVLKFLTSSNIESISFIFLESYAHWLIEIYNLWYYVSLPLRFILIYTIVPLINWKLLFVRPYLTKKKVRNVLFIFYLRIWNAINNYNKLIWNAINNYNKLIWNAINNYNKLIWNAINNYNKLTIVSAH